MINPLTEDVIWAMAQQWSVAMIRSWRQSGVTPEDVAALRRGIHSGLYYGNDGSLHTAEEYESRARDIATKALLGPLPPDADVLETEPLRRTFWAAWNQAAEPELC